MILQLHYVLLIEASNFNNKRLLNFIRTEINK